MVTKARRVEPEIEPRLADRHSDVGCGRLNCQVKHLLLDSLFICWKFRLLNEEQCDMLLLALEGRKGRLAHTGTAMDFFQ